MSDVTAWSPNDSDNTAPPPDGWPEFMQPSMVNNTGRMMMGAIRRMQDKLNDGSLVLPYLKLSGGSLSGGLGISGGLTASGTVQGSYLYSTGNANVAGALGVGTVNAGAYWMGSSVVIDQGSGSTFVHAPGGGVGVALNPGGNGYFAAWHRFSNAANTVAYLTIDGAGLSVTGGVGMSGPMTCGNANITGSASVGNGLTVANSIIVSSSGISVTGGVGMSGPVTVGGNANISGSVYASTMGLSGPTFYLANDSSFGMQLLANNNRLVGFAGGWYFEFDLAGPDDLNYTTPYGIQFQWRVSDGFCFAARGPGGGNGGYVNISDRRFKNAETITPSTAGLPEILQLQPVEFQRLPQEGGPPPVWELGFVAQDVAPVLPQAVNIIGVELPDGSGGRDSSEPTLGLTAEAITAALVNCVKTLDARLTALEGGGE